MYGGLKLYQSIDITLRISRWAFFFILCHPHQKINIYINHSAAVNTKKWAFSGQMGSRCKFVVTRGLFSKFVFSPAVVGVVKSAEHYAENKYNTKLFILVNVILYSNNVSKSCKTDIYIYIYIYIIQI
jgi:hypothetical protein